MRAAVSAAACRSSQASRRLITSPAHWSHSGELNLVGGSLDHFGVVRWKLEQMGVEFSAEGAVVSVRMDRAPRPGACASALARIAP